jgi:hypothetical protein
MCTWKNSKHLEEEGHHGTSLLTHISRGPLLFCLLLSFFLSINAREDQRSQVFSGVFAMIWMAEAIVTFQIKLLGGTMYVCCIFGNSLYKQLTTITALSSNRSASSATHSSRSSSRHY